MLVVVESPTKAKKIQQFLGDGYQVLPSGGHVRDLPPKALGVDLSTFRADYEVLEQKASFLARIRAAAKGAEHVFLASDPDRRARRLRGTSPRSCASRATRAPALTRLPPRP
ncbi:toprim domain-containing protein [Cystobacter fuscus]